jgi:CheY-like chemotaxis protein
MNARILMVDDEPDAEELFRQNFRREIRIGTIIFDFAQSGFEALELLESKDHPEVILVLSDINMPGMTGIELLEKVRQRWPDIPVFMITAYGDRSTEHKVREKGASSFITKPVDFVALKDQLLTLTGTC